MTREIDWTKHASERLAEWGLNAFEVEEAIRRWGHRRRLNQGKGDWHLIAPLSERKDQLVVIYDQPAHKHDRSGARIVTVWTR
jgi:hypothetical protein